jgi:hypothetical protein
MAERELTEREMAECDVAEYERWAADNPDVKGIDASDLAAIGAARYKPGITHEEVADLVRVALANGRSWLEIADRLSMTVAQARRSYEKSVECGKDVESTKARISTCLRAMALCLINVLQRVLGHTADAVREHSRH